MNVIVPAAVVETPIASLVAGEGSTQHAVGGVSTTTLTVEWPFKGAQSEQLVRGRFTGLPHLNSASVLQGGAFTASQLAEAVAQGAMLSHSEALHV
jgi:hypothetical protein